MHIQVSEAMFAALTASQLGYVMKQRGEVEIKVRRQILQWYKCATMIWHDKLQVLT